MVPRSASFATLDGPSVSTAPSAFVRQFFGELEHTQLSFVLDCAHHFCAGNTCTCSNGVAQTGADCPVDGASKCHTGWSMNSAETECICKCAHVRFLREKSFRKPSSFRSECLHIHAVMAWRKLGQVVLWTVLRNASYATLGGA